MLYNTIKTFHGKYAVKQTSLCNVSESCTDHHKGSFLWCGYKPHCFVLFLKIKLNMTGNFVHPRMNLCHKWCVFYVSHTGVQQKRTTLMVGIVNARPKTGAFGQIRIWAVCEHLFLADRWSKNTPFWYQQFQNMPQTMCRLHLLDHCQFSFVSF